MDSPGLWNSSGSKTDTKEAKIWTHEHSHLRWSLVPCTDTIWALLDSATLQELHSWKEDFCDSQTKIISFNTNMVGWMTWEKKNLRSSVSSSLASPQPPFVHVFFAPIHPLSPPTPFPLASCSWLTLPQPQWRSSWSWTPWSTFGGACPCHAWSNCGSGTRWAQSFLVRLKW